MLQCKMLGFEEGGKMKRLLACALVGFSQFCCAMIEQVSVYPSVSDSRMCTSQECDEKSELLRYYSLIAKKCEIAKKTNLQDKDVVKILSDAIKNTEKVFEFIDNSWPTSGESIGNDPTLQKMYCVGVLYELYTSLITRFENIDTEAADEVRENLRKLHIIE